MILPLVFAPLTVSAPFSDCPLEARNFDADSSQL